jgi:hypothetical protein
MVTNIYGLVTELALASSLVFSSSSGAFCGRQGTVWPSPVCIRYGSMYLYGYDLHTLANTYCEGTALLLVRYA